MEQGDGPGSNIKMMYLPNSNSGQPPSAPVSSLVITASSFLNTEADSFHQGKKILGSTLFSKTHF